MIKIKLIGIYQILATIILLVSFFIGNSKFSLWLIPIYLVVFVLMAYIFYASYKLFDNPLKGIKLSIFAQLFQVFSFSIPGFIYLYSTSSFLSIVIKDNLVGINFTKEIAAINIRFDNNIVSFGIQIFLIPIIIMMILITEGFKIEKKKEMERDQILKNNYAQQQV